ncbi:MAG: hypothetical protein MUE78_06230 [Ilumatobacteraceae bacterium]|nr:hypothetical protein [Ilumatobacteraceae bacterium]
MPDRPPSEHDVDRLLRDAGARLRATAPTTVTPSTRRRPRWIVPLTIGTVAAASIAIIVAITGRSDDTLEQLPAEPAPVVTDATTVTTAAPEPTEPTAPGTDAAVTTTIVEPAFSVAVDQVGWDGPGSACLTLDGAVTGCFPGGSISADSGAPTTAWVLTDDGGGAFDVSIVDGEVSAVPSGPEGVPCPGDVPYRSDTWLIGLVCGRGAALWEALPSGPTGPPAPEATHGADGGVLEQAQLPVRLERVPSADWRIYTADLDLGYEARCTLVVPDDTGWYESCDVSQGPAHPGTLLVEHDGEVHLVDPTDGEVEALGDVALRTNGCDTSIRDLVGELGGVFDGAMVRAIACRGDDATGAVGAVWLQSGPPDGSLVTWQRESDGEWQTTDYGTGIEPDVSALPLPPTDVVLAELDVAAVGFTDATETVRDWMAADPSLTIPDAIAAGVPDALGVERFDTLAMVAIPSLTFVEVTYPDDSIGSGRYAVWTTEPDDGSDPLLVAWRWDLCTRGATPDGLCV